ncbi:RNA polymerase-associated protein RapA [Aliiglaciecola sp. CAU 1673]|uniref:RNA polymerase-associated protein RapA n=1 Tax=Aliiglaciecola sp. CAU 1673 TaxID=3032595 RepID=UPI0023DA9A5F|nr:RNA polymerase-associated protein RapA [Aliiglaciecola sp. CAU 1673]MDF2179005.1 RNA polymerase-associated protein RapA [Aliiglaciecola sp. CAU 1673]
MSFALGQRWISNTESELGLGTVVDCQSRTVTLLFPATGESRTYTLATAPLTRVTFEVDDKVRSHEGWQMLVERVEELDELLTYHGKRLDNHKEVALRETMLDHHFQLDQPEQRLFSGQFDDPKWFDLRLGCLEHQHQHQSSPLLGMTGARVDLIPHQLHIANEVASRFAPRVLLADEVGLGKTIEAALILHRQILTGRASRVLILVPSSLVHQWLVEMRRRVNLAFAIFDEERLESLLEEGGNPFDTEQLVLCSLDFLTNNDKAYQQALAADWDLLIVDEAHHLKWSSEAPSREYQVVEGLSAITKGVLLLTATPDQLGHESHFARLRLLDPARFHDYQAFLAEEQQYASLANAIGPLLEGQALDNGQIAAISVFAPEEQALLKRINQASEEDKQRLIGHLIDRHGTGRILFRNSRAGIKGFPKRKLQSHELPLPALYAALPKEGDKALIYQLTPERHPSVQENWTNDDPRVDWFIQLLQRLKGEKVLTICASAATALQLAEALRVKSGIRAGVFHEGQSIVERDRVANFFAQNEEGAQVLICSEIGSEGRNFQFAHHLALFDLPLVPDLLEQRIGRLDRIGQKQDVLIHVPYFQDSAQESLLNWYHQGLNAFEQTCPTGTVVFDEVKDALLACLLQSPEADFPALLAQTQSLHQALKSKLEAGRDKLLELNSSGRNKVGPLVEAIADMDQSPRLERFMTQLFDGLGILQEENDESSYFLRPGESMVNQLPGLDEEGLTITYERATALAREDVHFFSADHPMIQHALDMLLTDVLGKSSIALSQNKALANGSYFIECLFVLSARAEKSLQLQRFLPPTPIRICLDAQGKVQDIAFGALQSVNAKMGQQLIQALGKPIEAALGKATGAANKQAAVLRHEAMTKMQQQCGEELDRLLTLKKLNPSIRDEEIQHQARQLETLGQLINQSAVTLEALRLVVNSH